MKLISSSRDVTNAVYTNESGQVIYKVSTPFRFSKVSSISRIIPSDVPGGVPISPSSSGTGTGTETETRTGTGTGTMKDRFGKLATVEHRLLKSSVIHYGGQEIKTSEYFRKVGFGWYGRHRAFIGPDGKDYKWILGRRSSKLVLNNTDQTPVAKFHKKSFGFIGKAHPSFLEIFPVGENIVDHIFVLFIFIEKIRQDKEDAASSGAGG